MIKFVFGAQIFYCFLYGVLNAELKTADIFLKENKKIHIRKAT